MFPMIVPLLKTPPNSVVSSTRTSMFNGPESTAGPTVKVGAIVTSDEIWGAVIEMQFTFVVTVNPAPLELTLTSQGGVALASWLVPAMIATTEVVMSRFLIVSRSIVIPPTGRLYARPATNTGLG